MRAARGAIALGIGFLPAAVWITFATSGSGESAWPLIAGIAILGAPLAFAFALLVDRASAGARGHDMPERLLSFAAAGLRGRNADWGNAMQAELASIDDRHERRRFAIGCALTALRIGMGRRTWLIAFGTGLVFAVGTYAASRIALDGGRGGIMGDTLLVPILVLFALAVVTARITRSFRTGLITGCLALVAGLVGMLTMAMVEAGYWYEFAGVYVMDGDGPKGHLSRLDAVLDPLAPQFVFIHLQFWAPWPVLGAAAGSRRRHLGAAASAAAP